MPSLAKLTALRELNLAGTSVEGRSLAAIVELPHLEELNLDNCPIGDDGLLPFARMSSEVRRLSLKYADFTDKGLSGLSGFPKLTHLDLASVDIGDTGLAAVGSLTQLEELNLKASDASPIAA